MRFSRYLFLVYGCFKDFFMNIVCMSHSVLTERLSTWFLVDILFVDVAATHRLFIWLFQVLPIVTQWFIQVQSMLAAKQSGQDASPDLDLSDASAAKKKIKVRKIWW